MQNGIRPRQLLIGAIVLNTVGLGVVVALALQSSAWTAPASARNVKNPVTADAKSTAEGREIYDKYCAMCHGENGRGDGPMSEMLKSSPADLGPAVQRDTDGEMFWKISEGRDPMPAFGKKLTKDEIWKAIHHLRAMVAARK